MVSLGWLLRICSYDCISQEQSDMQLHSRAGIVEQYEHQIFREHYSEKRAVEWHGRVVRNRSRGVIVANTGPVRTTTT